MDKRRWMREVRRWAAVLVAVAAFRTVAYEPVHIPSGSMIPSLQIGDYVIVEKWAYGARVPFTKMAQATWASPQRGDIVVLLAPSGSSRGDDLIKRVVAVAGDTVEISNGRLVVNGRPVPEERSSGACSYWDEAEGGRWHQEPCVDYVEHLGRHRYHTYCTPKLPCGDVPEQPVPPGMVWVAGDHRDHSADSRVFGPVPVGRIKGRAWLVLGSWGPNGLRWNRVLRHVDG